MTERNRQHTRAKPPKAVPAGSFMMRRVFRIEDDFICGICRERHPTTDKANRCLESCWQTVLKRAPWTPVRRIGKVEFACIYCQRSYQSTAQASSCAVDCSSKMTISSLDGRNLAPNKPKREFFKPNNKVSVNFPFKIGGRDTTATENHNDAVDAAAISEEPVSNVTVEPTKPTAPEPPKVDPNDSDSAGKEKAVRDRTKKFERAGSKYVCIICQKKYFEKVEVERCFDSHSGGSMDAHQNSGV